MRIKIAFYLSLLFTVQLALGQNIVLFSKENSDLIDNDLVAVTVDDKGNTWIGTSKYGLVKFNNGNFIDFNKDNSEIKGDYVSQIFTDSKGNVWVLFSNPEYGIAKFDGKEWISYMASDINSTHNSVFSIVEDNSGNLLFGGKDGVLKHDGENWISVDLPEGDFIIRTMDINSNGDLAIGHNSELLIKKGDDWFDLNKENSELRLGTVRGVKYIKDNKLIVGYGGGFGDGGFSIIENDLWTHYNRTNSNVQDHMVRDIEIGENGAIWMATNNGIIRMMGEEITPIMFREGMFKNVVLDIEIDRGNVWIATNFGLIRIEE